MTRRLWPRAALPLALIACAAGAQTQRITDATGRSVAVPASVERVYAAGPPASVILLALAPQKLIGWTRAPHPDLLLADGRPLALDTVDRALSAENVGRLYHVPVRRVEMAGQRRIVVDG